MSVPTENHSESTSDKILNLAQEFIQTRGYHAFSYKDIAAELGIKTASVHYHFAKKETLGCAVVQRYTQSLDEALERVLVTIPSAWKRFDFYLVPFLDARAEGSRVCLCAALGGELLALPNSIRDEVKRFFVHHERWLYELVSYGVSTGDFHVTQPVEDIARQLLSALQGALIIARAKNDPEFFYGVVRSIKVELAGWGAASAFTD